MYADQWAQGTKGKLHFLYVSQMPEMSYYPAHFEQADKFDETEQIARLDAFLTPINLKADQEICDEYGTPYYKISRGMTILSPEEFFSEVTRIICCTM